jgi:hypothetical protein
LRIFFFGGNWYRVEGGIGWVGVSIEGKVGKPEIHRSNILTTCPLKRGRPVQYGNGKKIKRRTTFV